MLLSINKVSNRLLISALFIILYSTCSKNENKFLIKNELQKISVEFIIPDSSHLRIIHKIFNKDYTNIRLDELDVELTVLNKNKLGWGVDYLSISNDSIINLFTNEDTKLIRIDSFQKNSNIYKLVYYKEYDDILVSSGQFKIDSFRVIFDSYDKVYNMTKLKTLNESMLKSIKIKSF